MLYLISVRWRYIAAFELGRFLTIPIIPRRKSELHWSSPLADVNLVNIEYNFNAGISRISLTCDIQEVSLIAN